MERGVWFNAPRELTGIAERGGVKLEGPAGQSEAVALVCGFEAQLEPID